MQVFATEAMRTAKNRDEMLDAIKRESGLTVDILSPAMESLFGAMGARSGFNHVDGLFMDLGGGSVQMTYINSEAETDYDILAAESATSELPTFSGNGGLAGQTWSSAILGLFCYRQLEKHLSSLVPQY